ncbi:MAG: amidohydrolase family protein [Thermomicrobiales bacterium]|nr:amidohydrolase family protein [Thermomicrobiales bacterium]
MSQRVPVVDAHHHFWMPGRYDYYWMAGPELEPIRRPFGPGDLKPLLDAAGVDATVLVQTVPSVEETREFLRIAEETPFVAGVVGWVDLTDPDVGEMLAGLQASPEGSRLVGIRHQVHDEADADWLLRPEVQRGLAAVRDAELAYDILIRPRELPAAIATARAFPDLRLVVDHLAKPSIASGEIAPWATQMRAFGDMPHVSCKLSGMITEADWNGWTVDDLRPYVQTVMEIFGPERVMYGSDWPVCLLAGDYASVKHALEEALPALTEAQRVQVFGGNAIEFYRLGDGCWVIGDGVCAGA